MMRRCVAGVTGGTERAAAAAVSKPSAVGVPRDRLAAYAMDPDNASHDIEKPWRALWLPEVGRSNDGSSHASSQYQAPHLQRLQAILE